VCDINTSIFPIDKDGKYHIDFYTDLLVEEGSDIYVCCGHVYYKNENRVYISCGGILIELTINTPDVFAFQTYHSLEDINKDTKLYMKIIKQI
jgi:hypothetical protein